MGFGDSILHDLLGWEKDKTGKEPSGHDRSFEKSGPVSLEIASVN
jgi:hypothetical protein